MDGTPCGLLYVFFHYFLKEPQEDTDMLRGPRDVKCCLVNFSFRQNRPHCLQANHSSTINPT